MDRQILGDDQFVGVNLRLEAQRLPAGYVADAVNCRFRDGTAKARKGTLKVPWVNKITAGEVYPWGTVYGTGEFRDPVRKQRYLLIATASAVYATLENNAPFSVTVPAGFALTDTVTFAHGPDVVVMLRGSDAVPLRMVSIMDGFEEIDKLDQWSVVLDYPRSLFELEAHGFLPGDMVQFTGDALPAGLLSDTTYWVYDTPGPDHFRVSSDAQLTTVTEFSSNGLNVEVIAKSDGASVIPSGQYGFFLANRLFVIRGDIIYASDLLDYTRCTVYNEFRIHQGGGEALVNAVPFGDSTVVCFKDRSVIKVTGVYGDLSARRQAVVTTRYGAIAPRSIVDVGTDLVWLSSEGVASLSMTEYGEVQSSQGAFAGKPPMLSDDIEPLIRRINWRFASGAVATHWDNKLFVAVPLDDAEALQEELVEPEDIFSSTPGRMFCSIPVTVGARYRFVLGEEEQYLVNKLKTALEYVDPSYEYYDAAAQRAGVLTALETGVYFIDYDNTATECTGSLRRVFEGVNNAVLVYDFTTRSWQGYDEFNGLDIVEFRKFSYLGRERLFFWTSDGYGVLYEESLEDTRPECYSEFVVTAKPAVGDTVSVNGGATVTAANLSGNTDTQWGCSTLATAQANLWSNTYAGYGFGAWWGTRWARPNAAPRLLIDDDYGEGIRFTSTNGLLPVITTTGTWPIVRGSRTQPIRMRVKTRAYTELQGNWHRGVWVNADLSSLDPSTTWTILSEGVKEEIVLDTDNTKDRTAYYVPWDAAAWTESNGNDDFCEPYREDYSIRLGGDEVAGIYLGCGVLVQQEQICTERYHLVARKARSYQLQVENGRGRCGLMSVRLESGPRSIVAAANA